MAIDRRPSIRRRANPLGSTALAAASLAAVLVPAVASARTPLPTVEVVQPPRRVRLIDVRGPVQWGWGWSNVHRAPVYLVSFEVQASMIEISDTTWLHLVLGQSGVISAVRRSGQEHLDGMLGADLGLGLSRYAPRGPAFSVTVTAGPRWATGGPERLRPHGHGVQGKAEVYPFYMTVPEIVNSDHRGVRRYVLSGLSLWASTRWDDVLGRRGSTWAGGLGFDVGRSLILPVLQAVGRRR